MRALATIFASALLGLALPAAADPAALADLVRPPFSLGEPVEDQVYELRNAGGAHAGYVFETAPLAPLPGFSGAPINALVQIDLEGRFLDVRLVAHNEPIFVSGLGEAPFHAFFEQYPGLSLASQIVVGSPYGEDGSGPVYLDGVTKATASVRIAHDSVMAATLKVARSRLQGLATGPPAAPDPTHDEALSWDDIRALASHHVVSNAQVDAGFANTLWADDDPQAKADPQAPYLDLWLIDLGPPAIARAVLSGSGFAELQGFLELFPDEEPLLLIERARHGLTGPDFMRNTPPELISASQDGLPVTLRDADLLVELSPNLPAHLHEGRAMILRSDRRLGFDPSRPWQLGLEVRRQHGMFHPEVGSQTLLLEHSTPERFFIRPTAHVPVPPWREALRNRQADLMLLTVALSALALLLGPQMNAFAARPFFTRHRLAILAAMLVFVGWWGQGQLSIVTVLGVLRTALEGGSFTFLVYDPFSLLIWGAALLGFIAWGRGLFCGWLCPFGALQEFAHHLGRWLRLPQYQVPKGLDRPLRSLKYLILAGLVGTALIAPDQIDTVAEVEPFKTAITTYFLREWYYAAYAALWLLLGMVLFKGFCRYVCPLGAVMAIGGLLRQRDWIARRSECGSPCQLCKVKCAYGAIEKGGKVTYSECFQCLDCVAIHDDHSRCVPLILAAKRASKLAAE